MSRRHVYMFSACFADKILSGEKTSTIRPWPKDLDRRVPNQGDIIDCRRWKGVPYRKGSTKQPLGSYLTYGAQAININKGAYSLPGMVSGPCDVFARSEGFDNWDAFVAWIDKAYGLPFYGIHIRWI